LPERDTTEIDDNPTAGRTRSKKEVFRRLVRLGGNFAVMELIQLAAVVVAATVDNGERRICCHIFRRNRRNNLELELGCAGFVGIVNNNCIDSRMRRRRPNGELNSAHQDDFETTHWTRLHLQQQN